MFFIAMFTVGLFNNNGYVMVGAGSSELATTFNKEDLMPLFSVYLASSLTFQFIDNLQQFNQTG